MSGLAARIDVSRSDGFRLDVDLSIAPGETVALLGPNGAGKSTAVAAIAGLLPIDSGHIAIDGSIVDDPAAGSFVAPERRQVGVMFQDDLLFPHLNVVENVAFGLRSRGVDREEAHSRSRGWLARVGLAGFENSKPGELSGGQAQRVALARALVPGPHLLLLDEPLAALDVTTRTRLRHTLEEHLSAFAGPRLLITHEPSEAFLLADRIHVVEHGTVTQSGTSDEIRLRPRTAYAADLAGANFIEATASRGVIQVGGHTLYVADDIADGPVLVTIHPTAVSVHTRPPDGSPRNAWATNVERVELLGTRVRIRTGAPMALTVELTEAARAELALEPGAQIWVAVKATEIGVQDG